MNSDFHGSPPRRLKVLISAYACCPHHGSEPEVGWAFSKAMAAYHEVWVLTRAANREGIERELEPCPIRGLHFLYYDPPDFFEWGRHGGLRIQLHSYVWQLLVIPKVRRVHKEVGFDVAHHVTFAKYWAPSALAWLPVPFVWGPVGGGEGTPPELLSALTRRERWLERMKRMVSRAGERDPFVRKTAREAARVFASTNETAVRLKRMGCQQVAVMTQIGADGFQVARIERPARPCRFMSIGRLVHWKGFLLGLQAFEGCGVKDAEYWIVGDGPSRSGLMTFILDRDLEDRVTVFGGLSHLETARQLALADVLIHPSFHDSAGLVCLEAMALAKPVICLQTGGPADLIDDACGIRVPIGTPDEVRKGLCDAMTRLASDPYLRRRMGAAAVERVRDCFTWKKKAEFVSSCYLEWAGAGESL